LLSSNREEGRQRETKRETAHEEGDTHVLSNWLLLLWVCAKCSFGAHLFVGLLGLLVGLGIQCPCIKGRDQETIIKVRPGTVYKLCLCG